MNLGVVYKFGGSVLERPVAYWQGLRVKPLVVLRPSTEMQQYWGPGMYEAYERWVKQEVKCCQELKLYAVVEIPINGLTKVPATNEDVKTYVGEAYPSVWAVYLSQGALKRDQYWLRVYGLVRQGLVPRLLIERDYPEEAGTYCDLSKAAAFGRYTTEIGFQDLRKKFPTIYQAAGVPNGFKTWLLSKLMDDFVKVITVQAEVYEQWEKTLTRWSNWSN